MKKICMITTDDYLYDPRVYWREAVSLAKKYDITYIAMDDGRKDIKGITEEKIKFLKFKLKGKKYKVNLKKQLWEQYTYSLDSFKEIFDFIKKENYDVFHIQGLYSIFLIKYLKNNFPNSKIIYECREYHPDGIRDYNKTKGFKTINKYLYSYYMSIKEKLEASKSDYIIVTDDSIYKRFKGINKGKIQKVYNFTNISIENNIKNIKKEYDLVYCGGISFVRGILQIIKAVNIAKYNGRELKCLLLGSIVDQFIKQKMDEYIKNNGLEKNIIFKGRVDFSEVPQYLLKSKIGMVTLMPISKYKKNIPMKQFEYMAYGLPIIGSDLPPIRNFVGKSNSGILVDPNKEYDIYNTIIKILDDKQLYKQLSDNGIMAVKKLYNWKQSEKKLFDIYDELDKNSNI